MCICSSFFPDKQIKHLILPIRPYLIIISPHLGSDYAVTACKQLALRSVKTAQMHKEGPESLRQLPIAAFSKTLDMWLFNYQVKLNMHMFLYGLLGFASEIHVL